MQAIENKSPCSVVMSVVVSPICLLIFACKRQVIVSIFCYDIVINNYYAFIKLPWNKT